LKKIRSKIHYHASMRLLAISLMTAMLPSCILLAADDPFGAALFQKHCASCHDQGGDTRIPARSALQQMTAAAVTRALDAGAMREVGATLSSGERRALATWLGKAEAVGVMTDAAANRCASSPALSVSSNAPAWSGWSAGLNNARFQEAAAAGLAAADVPKLKLKWAFGLPDATTVRSQPAVYAGRVFVASPDALYSLDAASGCVHWATSVAAPVRSGIAIANVGNRVLAVYGDVSGHVRAFDAATGQPAWQVSADDHPATMVTSTPVFYNGRLYVGASSYEEARATTPGYVCCTFRGSVQAIDAATGKVLWKTYTIAAAAQPGKPTQRGAKTMGPSGAGIWASPTLDPEHNALYVTTGDNYSDPATTTSDAVLAVAMDTGKLLWSQQLTANDAFNSTCSLAGKAICPDSDGPDFDFGASAILLRLAGGKRVLVLPQKSGMLHGVDPDQQGKILWHAKAGEGGTLGGIQWGAASDGARVYVALSDIRFTAQSATGRRPDPERGGGMFAFRADNGERLWMTPAPKACADRSPCSPAQSAAVSAIAGAVFSGAVDGHLRAYSAGDGKIIWDYDTAHAYQTANGVPAKGGAMDSGGAVIAGGMVFVGSGYGQWGGLPGNVLLAFGAE
jgi:polyvinyl alcohol dehydrogenase (cytochrome)